MTRLRRTALSISSGLLLAAAFPPLNWSFLAWLWLLPLLWVLWKSEPRRGWRQAWFGFAHGWLAGFVFFVGTLWWIGHVTVVGVLAMCVYLALYFAVWGAFAAGVRPNGRWRSLLSIICLAGLWAGLEWLRSVMLTGFAWNSAAVPIIDLRLPAAFASVMGASGVSMIPLYAMAAVAAGFFPNRGGRVGSFVFAGLAIAFLFLILLTVNFFTGATQYVDRKYAVTGFVRAHLIQQNISMERRRTSTMEQLVADYDEEVAMSEAALEKQPADFVIWPESGIPGLFSDPSHDERFMRVLSRGAALITGTDARSLPDSEGSDMPLYNCLAFMHRSPDNFRLHAKVHLVPFGEFVPLREELPWLAGMLEDLIPTDFSRGKSHEPLRLDGLPFDVIPLVCFEDTTADHARQFVRDRHQIMVNVTNDNWFAESPGAEIQMINARWRAIELRRPLLRGTNTGVTCAIDINGRVTARLDPFTTGVLTAEVNLPADTGFTFYATHGEIVSKVSGAAGLLGCMVLLIIRRSEGQSTL